MNQILTSQRWDDGDDLSTREERVMEGGRGDGGKEGGRGDRGSEG